LVAAAAFALLVTAGFAGTAFFSGGAFFATVVAGFAAVLLPEVLLTFFASAMSPSLSSLHALHHHDALAA
jgi:hypothetical protein